jgi:hypothetical protein
MAESAIVADAPHGTIRENTFQKAAHRTRCPVERPYAQGSGGWPLRTGPRYHDCAKADDQWVASCLR